MEENKKTSFIKELLLFLKDFVVCAAVVLVVTHWFVRPIQVLGSSMYPTLEDQEIGISNVLGAKLRHFERFDIAIVYVEQKDEYLVKRIVGLPGETVRYSDGQLYINDEPIEENFLDTDYRRSWAGIFMGDVDEITLGEDEYFCLGDNRPRSSDSRVYGPFSGDKILAKGTFIIFPFNKIGPHTW